MARPINWWRLYRGKVWHISWAGDAAACGTEPGSSAEYVGERAPVNARVCSDCVATALHLYGLAQAGQIGDPRKTFDPWAAGEALIALGAGPESDDGVVDAEVVEDDDGYCIECPHSLDSHGPQGCRERDENDPLDGPCPCQYPAG